MVVFGSPETWGMKVDEFLDTRNQTPVVSVPTPTQQLFGINRQELNQGGLINNKKFLEKVQKLRNQKKPVKEIAEKLKTSTSTIERTIRKIGFVDKRIYPAQEKLKQAYEKFVQETGKIPRIQDMRNAGLSYEAIVRAQKQGVEFGRRGEGRGSAKAKVVNDDLIAMSKNKKILDALDNEIIPNINDVIKVTSATDETSALNRLIQFSDAITEGRKGLDLNLNKYKKGANFILDNAEVLSEQIREIAEKSIGASVGEVSIVNPRKDISRQKILTGYNIDEPAGVMSSYRRGSRPYGIFSQAIGTDLNVGDKFSFDVYKSIKEKEIQEAKGNKRIQKVNEFNKAVSKYEKLLNQDRKPGELKVRLFKASLKNPSQTIKRFNQFPKEYQKAFTDNYEKLGYSFEVPKDVKTIFEIQEDIKNPAIAKQIKDRIKSGAPRVYSFPAMFEDMSPKELLSEVVEGGKLLGKGVKTLGKAAFTTPLGITALTAGSGIDPESSLDRVFLAGDLAAAPALVKGAERMTRGITNPLMKRIAQGTLNLPFGVTPAMAARVARVASPLGIASLVGEGAYQFGKAQKKYLEGLEPEQRIAVEQEYRDVAAAEGGIIRKAYKDAGLVEKLGRGAAAFDPRNLPYYGAKTLKGLGSGVEMAVKIPVAAGAALAETIQKGPKKETLTKFGEAVQPSATQYLSEKTGLESLIRKQEKELAEKRPGALAMGDVLELGAEFVAPATGYIKMIEDGGSKLYKVLRNSQEGKKVDPKDIDEVLEVLSDKGVSRRDFLSIVGGTSIYALAKHIGIVDAVKISQKIKPVRMLSKSTTKMPEWFPNMIEKVLDDTGNSIFKQIDEDAVLITNKEMPGIEITKYDNGRLEVFGENNYGAKYYIEYDPAKYLDDGSYFPGDFSATDTRFYSLGPDDYTKENEIVDQVDDIFGGTDKMREYATGQKKKELTRGEKEAIEAELRAESFTDEID